MEKWLILGRALRFEELALQGSNQLNCRMLEIIHTIAEQNLICIRESLSELGHLMRPKPGIRIKRLWLNAEWYQSHRSELGFFTPAVKPPDRLWQYCVNVCQKAGFNPDIGTIDRCLVGRNLNRTGRYAASKAVSIQIGNVEWEYDPQNPGYYVIPEEGRSKSKLQTYQLQNCAIAFNCKNLHAAKVGANSYSINL